MRFKDITGERFERLVVGKRLDNRGSKAMWLCKCDCGGETITQTSQLKSGKTKSCGCLRGNKKKHGRTGTVEHTAWLLMKGRCNNKNGKSYRYYGGRGISVCRRWMVSFEAFFSDMGGRPSDTHSIDRIDNDGDYCPENCRWADKEEQANNARSNVNITHNGETLSVSQWAKKTGIRPQTIFSRIRYGWEDSDKLLSPVGRKM